MSLNTKHLVVKQSPGKNRLWCIITLKDVQCPNAPKLISAVALPRTPLGELTTLPKPPSRLWGPAGRGTHPLHSPPHRCWSLDAEGMLISSPAQADLRVNNPVYSETNMALEIHVAMSPQPTSVTHLWSLSNRKNFAETISVILMNCYRAMHYSLSVCIVSGSGRMT